jgi:small subunit ribosomal protein S21
LTPSPGQLIPPIVAASQEANESAWFLPMRNRQGRHRTCRLSGSRRALTGGHRREPIQSDFPKEGEPVVKLNVRDRESIQEAVRRFRKLVERSGIKKEMRRREYYEKPSETRRRARLRAERRSRRTRLLGA